MPDAPRIRSKGGDTQLKYRKMDESFSTIPSTASTDLSFVSAGSMPDQLTRMDKFLPREFGGAASPTFLKY